jgi:Delta3-Delta2-enoyl-CoA isomerase
MAGNVISVEYKGRVAIITIDNDKKLNALSQGQYYELGQKLQEVATHDEVFVTVLIGKGRYFSAYVPHTPNLITMPCLLFLSY